MKTFFEEFKKFALRGNAVDLAVGIVIGGSFTAITNSLVADIVTPPLGLLIGGIDFSELAIPLGGSAVIHYGLFIEALVNFVLIALVLFLLVKGMNHLVRKQELEGQSAAKAPELIVLEQIRDELRKS